VFERSAALDVHKASVTACVRVRASGGGREQHIEEFAATVRGLLALRDRLAGFGVGQVAMEASGVYWKLPWAMLEDEFECLLVNARHVKQVPGRTTDVGDAEWLCRLVEAGLLRANFVPPKPIRQLRNLTRYRKTQIQARAREVNRLHKALEDAAIKLDCVAADIMGKSGRDMLDALVAGERDPEVLANLARRQMRKKIPALREALEGRFEAHHVLWIGAILAHIEFLDQQIERLTTAIGEQIAPLASAVDLLCTITGVQSRAAEVIISEIDGDMSRFPTRGTSPPGPANAPATTNPPASDARARPATGQSGWTGRAKKSRSRRSASKAPTCTPNTNDYHPDEATKKRSEPSNTPSSAPSGTSSGLARPTAPRRRLLHPPRPRTPHQATDPTTRTTRPHRLNHHRPPSPDLISCQPKPRVRPRGAAS
jgi:transposase